MKKTRAFAGELIYSVVWTVIISFCLWKITRGSVEHWYTWAFFAIESLLGTFFLIGHILNLRDLIRGKIYLGE